MGFIYPSTVTWPPDHKSRTKISQQTRKQLMIFQHWEIVCYSFNEATVPDFFYFYGLDLYGVIDFILKKCLLLNWYNCKKKKKKNTNLKNLNKLIWDTSNVSFESDSLRVNDTTVIGSQYKLDKPCLNFIQLKNSGLYCVHITS